MQDEKERVFESVIIVTEKDGSFCFFYGDKDHEEWPAHIKKQKQHREVKGFFIDSRYLITVNKYLWLTCPDVMRALYKS